MESISSFQFTRLIHPFVLDNELEVARNHHLRSEPRTPDTLKVPQSDGVYLR